MPHLIQKSVLAVTLTSASLLATVPAQAGIIDYGFTVTIDTVTAALFNQNFAGSFSFDDAQVPVPGFSGEDLYALQDFSFNFAGNLYSLGDLFYADAALLGGQFIGLDAGGLDFAFLPENGAFAASFSYDFGSDAGNGSLSFAPLVTVPEPYALWLLGGALAGLTGLSRLAIRKRKFH